MAFRPTPESYYYSGQGRVMIARRNPETGLPGRFFATGNVTALGIEMAVTNVDHRESMTGYRSNDLRLTTEKTVTFSMTLESLKLDNMSLIEWGNAGLVPGGTVTGEDHIFRRGGIYALAFPKPTTLVITSTGTTPAPIPALNNWSFDEDYGTVYIEDDAPAFAEADDEDGTPVIVAYAYAEHQRIDALTQAVAPERFIRFEGLNTVDGMAALVEIPRASFDPMAAYPLINEEIAAIEITGAILRDPKIIDNSKSKFFTERRFATDFTPSEEGALSGG